MRSLAVPSASEENLRLLWNHKIQYRVHKRRQRVSALHHFNVIHLYTYFRYIHPMTLQPKSGLGLYWGSVTIMFYGVRLLASRPTPVNFGGPVIFLLGFTPLAKGSSFKALKTRPPSHSHLLHNPLCFAPGPPRGGWEFGFAGRACRLNTQEAFWYLTGHGCWHQHAPPESYQPSVQIFVIYILILSPSMSRSSEYYIFLIPIMRTTCLTYLILIDFITLVIFGKMYDVLFFSERSFPSLLYLHPSYFQILISVHYSKHTKSISCLNLRPGFAPIQNNR
jgi:hypothetical protein